MRTLVTALFAVAVSACGTLAPHPEYELHPVAMLPGVYVAVPVQSESRSFASVAVSRNGNGTSVSAVSYSSSGGGWYSGPPMGYTPMIRAVPHPPIW